MIDPTTTITQAATCCYCFQDIGPEGPAKLVFPVLTFVAVGVIVAIVVMHLRSMFGSADP